MIDHVDDSTLSEYLDAALPPNQTAEVEAHLAACPDCAARLTPQRALFAALNALPDEVLTRDLSVGVLARLPQAPAPRITPMARAIFAIQALCALILLSIIGAIGLQLPFSFGNVSLRQVLNQFIMDALTTFSADWLSLQNALQNAWRGGVTITSQLTAPAIVAIPMLSWITVLAAMGALWIAGNSLLLRHPASARKNS